MSKTFTEARRGDQPVTAAGRRPDLRRWWRWSLALLMPIPMLAISVENVARPYGLMAGTQQQLAAAASSPGRLDIALWAAFIGVLLAIPATMALAWTIRRTAPGLALIGGLVMIIACSMWYATPSTDQLVRVAADSGSTIAATARVIDLINASPATAIALTVFLVGQAIGLVLLGFGLWRTPAAPRWTAVALAVSGIAHLAVSSSPTLTAASWLLTAIGFGGASLALLRCTDDAFDLPPAGTHSTSRPPSTVVAGTDVRRVWQWLLCLSAPIGAASIAVLRFLLPYDTTDSPRQVFARLLAAPDFERLQLWLGLVISPVVLCGVVAVIWVARRTAPVWTTVAATLCILGYSALFSGGSPSDALVLRAIDGSIPPDLAYRFGAATEELPQAVFAGNLFVAGHLFGTVLLGIALWRSKAVPAWVGLALAVSQPIHLWSAMSGNHPLDLVGWGLTAVCFGIAGVAALRLPVDEFDLPPLPTQSRKLLRRRVAIAS